MNCTQSDCVLCQPTAPAQLVYATADFSVVRAHEPELLANYPAFYRLIWTGHVKEFSDLAPAAALRCMQALAIIERCMIDVLQPDKVNLASLGNMVPHLHWHIIGRFSWDAHFPSPIWATATQNPPQDKLQYITKSLPQLEQILRQRLQSFEG